MGLKSAETHLCSEKALQKGVYVHCADSGSGYQSTDV